MHWQLSEAAGKIWKDLLTPLCVVVQLIFDIVWHTKISCDTCHGLYNDVVQKYHGLYLVKILCSTSQG